MAKRYEVVLPDELPQELGWSEAEVPKRIREAFVMDLLRLDHLSEAQAAAILGLDRWEILETMARHEVPAIDLTEEELREELSKGIRRTV